MLVKKLRSALKLPIALLSLRAILFSLTLVALSFGASAWWAFLYVAYAWYLYASVVRGAPHKLGFLFWVFIIVAGVGIHALVTGIVMVSVALLLGALLWLLLGVCSLIFTDATIPLSIFFYFLVFLVASYGAYAGFGDPHWWRIVAVYIFFLFSFREYMRFMLGSFSHRLWIAGAVIAFLATQILWISSLISWGFFIAATLTLISVMTLADIQLHYAQGALTKTALLRIAIFFLFFGLITALIPAFSL